MFLSLGLDRQLIFFGCNLSNITGPSPLIIYPPNTPYNYYLSVPIFKLTYNDTKRNIIILNGYDMAIIGK